MYCRLQAGAEPNKDKLQTASYKAKVEKWDSDSDSDESDDEDDLSALMA